MAGDGLWTLDELCGLVETALLATDASQPTARVREVPDRRTIRWYTTIGLLDRPAEMRGRKALYRRRHLLQLVAVKRLQARGAPLAEIQARLAGATDRMLAELACLEDGWPAAGGGGVAAAAAAAGGERARLSLSAGGLRAGPAATGARPPRFWAAGAAGLHAAAGGGAERPRPELFPAIRLGHGVTLTLGAAARLPGDEDLSAVQRAAEPLLDLLRQRGLDTPQP